MSLPEPVDLSHHLSRTTKGRVASDIKRFYKYFSIPGIGQIAGGLPNPGYFPYDTLEAKVALPDRFKPTPNRPVDPPSHKLSSITLADDVRPSSKLVVPHDSSEPDARRKIDLATALEYGTAEGYPPLYNFIREFTRTNLHPNVPYKGGPEVVMTCGNTDGFSKAIQALTNDWSPEKDPVEEREALLVEEYCYMNAVQTARPHGLNIVPVKIDDEGMKPSGEGGLEDVLENWDFANGKRPHLMYTVTIGQNPTGGTLSVQRRKEIYAICVKYDVIIIEDDPYWYIQFPSATRGPAYTPGPNDKSSGFPFLDSLIPSYLSVDYQGRVIRLDTFSKTIAPGCRLGWITAQPALIERILRITETSTQQPSGFVQSMVAQLIIGPRIDDDDHKSAAKSTALWKVDGWIRWLEGLRGNYERRMTAMCDILDEGKTIVKSGRRNSLDAFTEPDDPSTEWAVIENTKIYDFVRPAGGMFVWLRFNFSTHPLRKVFPLPQLAQALWVFWTKKPYLVLLSPGSIFAPTDVIKERDAWECYRICFAACEEDEIEPLSKRVVRGIQDFWRIKNREKIDELLKELESSGSNQDRINGDTGFALLTGFC